jgi:hypothetical protein
VVIIFRVIAGYSGIQKIRGVNVMGVDFPADDNICGFFESDGAVCPASGNVLSKDNGGKPGFYRLVVIAA